jgi:hypothetical protein
MKYMQRWRYIGLFMATILVLSNVGHGFAVDYGVSNPSFRMNSQCRLDFWTTSGFVAPFSGHNHNCTAELTAITDLSVSPAQQVASTLQQGFYLDPQDPSIRFWYWTLYSDLMFQVYDQSGMLIHEESFVAGFDSNEPVAQLERAFPTYAGQYLTAKITARMPASIAGQRVETKLYIDFAFDMPDGAPTGDGIDPLAPPDGGM